MKRLLGSNVDVIFKSDDDVVSGVLFDIEDEHIYIQNNTNLIITIPRDNIKYYISNSMQRALNINDVPQHTTAPAQAPKTSVQTNDSLSVYVNKALIIEIPVPPTFDLSVFHDDIMKIVLGDPDVKAVLAGRTQKSLEYTPGKVYFTIDDVDSEPLAPPPGPSLDSFSMTNAGISATSSYLNPSQMVTRLNKVTQKTTPEEDENE